MGKPYELGMNAAGETAGQVANYITADLRVFLGGNPLGTQLLDDLGERIYHALREAAKAAAESAQRGRPTRDAEGQKP